MGRAVVYCSYSSIYILPRSHFCSIFLLKKCGEQNARHQRCCLKKVILHCKSYVWIFFQPNTTIEWWKSLLPSFFCLLQKPGAGRAKRKSGTTSVLVSSSISIFWNGTSTTIFQYLFVLYMCSCSICSSLHGQSQRLSHSSSLTSTIRSSKVLHTYMFVFGSHSFFCYCCFAKTVSFQEKVDIGTPNPYL